MSSWDVVLTYFVDGFIPKSEYVYMFVIIGVCAVALWQARKMVSNI